MSHVLIIAENLELRQHICALLGQMDCRVTESSDGVEGIKEYMHERPDMVLCDLDASARDSLSAIRQIRLLDPNSRIVAMSNGDRNASRTTLEWH